MNVVNKLCQLHYTYVLYAVKHFCFFINESWLNVNVPTSCLDPESCLRMAIANWTCVSWVSYALGTIAVNVAWIEREFNACQTPRSMYPSIFNHFWDIYRVIGRKLWHFQTPPLFSGPVGMPLAHWAQAHVVRRRFFVLATYFTFDYGFCQLQNA